MQAQVSFLLLVSCIQDAFSQTLSVSPTLPVKTEPIVISCQTSSTSLSFFKQPAVLQGGCVAGTCTSTIGGYSVTIGVGMTNLTIAEGNCSKDAGDWYCNDGTNSNVKTLSCPFNCPPGSIISNGLAKYQEDTETERFTAKMVYGCSCPNAVLTWTYSLASSPSVPIAINQGLISASNPSSYGGTTCPTDEHFTVSQLDIAHGNTLFNDYGVKIIITAKIYNSNESTASITITGGCECEIRCIIFIVVLVCVGGGQGTLCTVIILKRRNEKKKKQKEKCEKSFAAVLGMTKVLNVVSDSHPQKGNLHDSEGEQIAESSGLEMTVSGQSHVLKMSSVQISHAGMYKYIVNEKTYVFQITVIEKKEVAGYILCLPLAVLGIIFFIVSIICEEKCVVVIVAIVISVLAIIFAIVVFILFYMHVKWGRSQPPEDKPKKPQDKPQG